jgi:GNAT superfamily N-acetyltransferase
VRVRAATTGDVDAIARLHADGILLTVHGNVLNLEARARLQDERAALWAVLLAEPPAGQRAFVLDDGHVAAFASAGPDPDKEADGKVFALFVERNLWGAGLGSQLLDAVERHLSHHHARAGLWVVEGNLRARGLYERRGWRTAGADKRQDGVRFIWYSKCLAT